MLPGFRATLQPNRKSIDNGNNPRKAALSSHGERRDSGGPQAWAEFCLRYCKRFYLPLAMPVPGFSGARRSRLVFDAQTAIRGTQIQLLGEGERQTAAPEAIVMLSPDNVGISATSMVSIPLIL